MVYRCLVNYARQGCRRMAAALFKKFSVSASADEDYHLVCSDTLELINKQEVAADMALAMVGPFTFQRMIKPFGSE